MGKNLIINRKTLWTIPNILTFIRLLSVPVYMTLVILGGLNNSHPQWYVYVGLGVMVFAASTDIVDGYIARRFNQGTYIGQLIDPIADKAMHVGALVCLSVVGYLHWAFIIFLVLREAGMIIIGSKVMNDVNIKANMLGKVASAIISIGVMACFFHPFIKELWGEFGLDWIVVTIGLILNWAAAVNYAFDTYRQFQENKAKTAEQAEGESQKSEENPTIEE